MKAHRTAHRKSRRRSAAANQAQRAFLPEAGHRPGLAGWGVAEGRDPGPGRPPLSEEPFCKQPRDRCLRIFDLRTYT
jgi:hypothetical protein